MAEQPIYLVSGWPRSGTSMLMRAVEAGGLSCIYDPTVDSETNRSSRRAGYCPNPHGYYESRDRTFRDVDWDAHRGRCRKQLRCDLGYWRDGYTCRAVYLLRDPEEIRQSLTCFFEPGADQMFRDLADYDAHVAADVAILASRGEVLTLCYADVVADPAGQLARLGWPIDVERAAATVSPELYRNRAA